MRRALFCDMQSPEGKRIPDLTLRIRRDGEWAELKTSELFGGRTVVAFGLPGAFTPTCSSSHVPRYNELAPVLAKHGVDEIAVISVNDAFVMDAWRKDQDADAITFVPDGNGELTKALGMLVDKSDLGFGPRSWRYSMLVRDGVVEKAFVEPDKPGDPFEVSDADTMLNHVAPGAKPAPDILLMTKPGCSHCARAKSMLDERGLKYEAVDSTPAMLRAASGAQSTPQVFIDGKHIGGADDLATHLASQ